MSITNGSVANVAIVFGAASGAEAQFGSFALVSCKKEKKERTKNEQEKIIENVRRRERN